MNTTKADYASRLLYSPVDTDDAWRGWKANCGPAAFAAVTRNPVGNVRSLFPLFPCKPWVNPTHMMGAMNEAGIRYEICKKDGTGQAYTPRYGLCFLQWDGPWIDQGINAAYRHTHWLGFCRHKNPMVYDVNVKEWISSDDWEKHIYPLFVREKPQITGWWIRWACEVLTGV